MEIEFFLLNYQRIKSESTRKMYRIYLARFADFLHNNSLRLEDVCPSHIRRFIAIVKNLRNYRTGEQGISDTTVQLHLAAISSYYSWLQERGGNVQNPLREMKFRREQEPRKVSPVCSSVADSMCSSDIDELNTALACVGRSSGVRVSEMSGMNKEDIEVVKFPGREPCATTVVTGKGRKRRQVAINSSALRAVGAYLKKRGEDSNPALFVSNRGRISIRSIQRRLKSLGMSAGDDHVHAHRLRHNFTTESIAAGVPEKQVQERLGQQDKNVIYRYISISDDAARAQCNRAMKKIYARENSPKAMPT